MKTLALKFFDEGYNCSQCIIKAFEEKYSYKINDDIYHSLSAVNTGFGIGTVCSALIGGIILFGLLFDEETAHKARLKLMASFDAYFGNINCSGLNALKNRFGGCDKVIAMTAFFTENIILEEGFRA